MIDGDPRDRQNASQEATKETEMICKVDDSPRWPITAADRQTIVDRLLAIAASDDTAAAIEAAEILIQMADQNRQAADE